MHPTQKRSPLPRRKALSISVIRNGKVFSFQLRPWAAGLTLAGFTLFSTVYVAATGYLIYRDDLLGTSLARQVAMQYAYEDRIAALRSEIDRVTSRHLVETQGVGEQLAALLGRQAVIDRHRLDLDELVERAGDNGVDVAAELARLPRRRPEIKEADAVQGNALAYVPVGGSRGDIITGSLIRVPRAEEAVPPDGELEPILSGVQSSLDSADEQQSSTLDALSAATQRKADTLSSALGAIGVTVGAETRDGPQGGPFIPAGRLHFAERVALLRRALDDITTLRQAADAMPVRLPIAGAARSSGFGTRIDPFLHQPAQHTGVDFVAAAGTEVLATGPGTVVSAGWNGGYGQMVEIRHANGVTTRYAHLSALLVGAGARVSAGTPVGRVGSTGRSTGPHLHYETRQSGSPVDPSPYLAAGRAL